jgi:hypothetical protein
MIVLFLAIAGLGEVAPAQNAWHEGFEGSQPSWRQGGGDVRFRVEVHDRLQGVAHTGQGCERLRIRADRAGAVYFAHDVGRPRAIDELLLTLWVRSERPGIQLLAQAVLPRMPDPRSGRPMSALIDGSTYNRPGTWEQLRLDDIPRALARQAHVLQTETGVLADPREAYLVAVILKVYTEPGATEVWIDDLDVAGLVGSPGAPADQWGPSREAGPAGSSLSMAASGTTRPQVPAPGSDAAQVLFSGSVLSVGGRPLLVRAIQYQGEPLAWLKRLGFNAIWLPRPATTELLDQCAGLGLWLICPPPTPPGGLPPGEAAVTAIGPGFDRVLAWDLGSKLGDSQLETVRSWAEQVRAMDPRGGRPLVCRPDSGFWAYSRCADVIVVGRYPLASSLELADYGAWIRECPRLMRPSCPVWTAIETQPVGALREQWAAFGRGAAPPASVPAEQLRLLVYTAVTAGSRGLVFLSDSRLDAADADARSRAASVELLNLELDLMEPWLAAGHFVTTVPGLKKGADPLGDLTKRPQKESFGRGGPLPQTEPEVIASVLRTDRARLMVPVWTSRGAQCVSGQAAARGVSFVVPGVPESYRAYEILPGELKALELRRVTGGVHVTLEEFGLTALVLLTQDPLATGELVSRARRMASRAAELQRQLAADKLARLEEVHPRLASRNPVPQASAWLAAARRDLAACDGQWAARNYSACATSAQRAERALRLLERADWEAAVAPLRRPVASPAALAFRTLPWHYQLLDYLAASPPGPNLLPAGDFEDLSAVVQAGWRHFQHVVPGVCCQSNLARAAAHSGRFGLRLAAHPDDPTKSALLVETPPVWITSPAVPVARGALVQIQGWVRIPAPLTGSADGLMVLDSLTGEALADRFQATSGWVPFSLFRVAPASGAVSVTFALSGLGEAWVDDVTIRSIEPARQARPVAGPQPSKP